jgi:hypothetical protein
MFCPDCGSEVAEGRKFCGKCGGQLNAAARSVEAAQGAPASPVETVVLAPSRAASRRWIGLYALVAVLAVLGGVAWWWFHRPAPAYKVEDPGIYPFQGLSADGKTVKTGFIDADGKVLVQPVWDAADSTPVLGQLVYCNEGFCGVQKDGKWGFVNTSGSVTIPAQFDSVGPFIEGFARVKLGSQIGFIDKTGRYVINPQFDNAGDFHGGLAAAHVDAGWGFINKAGIYVIKPQFPSADPGGFSNGLAAVCSGTNSILGLVAGKCGYIDRNGIFAIKPDYDSVGSFSEGLASVHIGNRWGFINSAGAIVINPQFDSSSMFSGGLAVVGVSGQIGTIDKQGKYVLNPGQYRVLGTQDGLLWVSTADGIGLLTTDGKWTVKPSKAISAISSVVGKVFYGTIGGQQVPISTSGKVLAGSYKGASLDSLEQDIENEKSAITSIRTLVAAELNYAVLYPDSHPDASVQKLGPANGTQDEKHANLIDATLATGTKDGYQFTEGNPDHRATTGMNYKIVAKPLTGHAGRTFCTQPEVGYDSQSHTTYDYQFATAGDGTVVRDASGTPLPLLDAQGKPVPWVVTYPIRYALPGDECTSPSSPVL